MTNVSKVRLRAIEEYTGRWILTSTRIRTTPTILRARAWAHEFVHTHICMHARGRAHTYTNTQVHRYSYHSFVVTKVVKKQLLVNRRMGIFQTLHLTTIITEQKYVYHPELSWKSMRVHVICSLWMLRIKIGNNVRKEVTIVDVQCWASAVGWLLGLYCSLRFFGTELIL